jgi:NTE family protein
LKNYAGRCGFTLPKDIKKELSKLTLTYRQSMLVDDLRPFLNSSRKSYIHLIDGGVSDNLGLRTAIDNVLFTGDFWTTLKMHGLENVRTIAFVVVNAETRVDPKWDRSPYIPPFGAIVSSYATISIERYNVETIAMLEESFDDWSLEIRSGRCPPGKVSTEPGACGDIKFYLIQVKFSDIESEEKRAYFRGLPTSFKLEDEEVDNLRELGRRLLSKSDSFRALLRDLER